MRKIALTIAIICAAGSAYAQEAPTPADLVDLEQARQICSAQVKLAARGQATIYNPGWEDCSGLEIAWRHGRGSGWSDLDQQNVKSLIARAPK